MMDYELKFQAGGLSCKDEVVTFLILELSRGYKYFKYCFGFFMHNRMGTILKRISILTIRAASG